MPHCIVEYSAKIIESLPVEQLMHAVYKGVNQSELFTAANIKVRACVYNDFYLPGAEQVFVHVNLKILSGRDLSQRKNLTDSVSNQLERLGIEDAVITVEVTKIEKESYVKKITLTV
ncbi:5-carboxymethyl-2-hydroxymuconate Delta-isomerase [Colwellia sp. C1TZA3]|uniref:5-carboxymethyl-2-hydroxymuconate Delta-isomerase n=1 Tax=Colwellia sp. C1TZA3 TaxID=2508879 RepID=UPI0011B9CE78|nr:5-carboxymethyl-2-hydroxymuconate isomerase [Colwellia sp. C1TZA3]TWX63083.1 5-carboxymethyl-2-hydroxymuconate isomerase [Colwellia sp. C1TZA3]